MVGGKKIKIPLLLIKIFNFEYWPYWIFYIPLVPYILWCALKARSLTFFTAVNPSIYLGGVVGESKIDILKQLSDQYKPVTIFITSSPLLDDIIALMKEKQITFPIICKPNVGERGVNVEKVYNLEGVIKYMKDVPTDFLIQEFVDYPLEFGIFYYRYPDNSKRGVSSIVKKGFLEITGDGISTILELLGQNIRARFVLDELKEKLGDTVKQVLHKGEKFYPQPIGNHCKGTKFINNNHLINNKLINIFDNIAIAMDGFFYGRFDLKVSSIEDLYEGKNIKIMEVNGVTSEPGHIYDPSTKLLRAYRDMIWHIRTFYQIARMNHRIGVRYATWKEFSSAVHAFYKK